MCCCATDDRIIMRQTKQCEALGLQLWTFYANIRGGIKEEVAQNTRTNYNLINLFNPRLRTVSVLMLRVSKSASSMEVLHIMVFLVNDCIGIQDL